MIQHIPWHGPHYQEGIEGQRICIVGYSHPWGRGGKDSPNATKQIVSGVINGTEKIRFFSQVRRYFGFEDNAAFWNRVIFFNYIPECVGGPDDRYKRGTAEQVKHAKARFLSLIQRDRPHKVLVFTKQGWSTFPATREEEATGKNPPVLSLKRFPDSSRGTYDAGGHIVMAFGLRHPQYANSLLMRRAVRQILDKPAMKRKP